ncbi:MAG: type III pantothenate kinase [Armatimonadota bacterium]
MAVDIGNSNVHCGVFDGPRLRRRWTVPTQTVRDTGELDLPPESARALGTVVVCSVAPSASATLREWLSRNADAPALWVESVGQTGLTTRYSSPESVGIDRLVACRAALEAYRGRAVVVDVGTATTVDLVTSDGVHLGGAIGPGVDVAANALSREAELLRPVRLDVAPCAIGTNTEECVRIGFVRGFAGLVDRLIEDAVAEAGWSLPDVPCVATGGRADLVARLSRRVREVRPALVLEGLRAIWQEARPPRPPHGD